LVLGRQAAGIAGEAAEIDIMADDKAAAVIGVQRLTAVRPIWRVV
jgi:hypothetical protein